MPATATPGLADGAANAGEAVVFALELLLVVLCASEDPRSKS